MWIENTPENATRVVQAIAQFGFASLGLQEADFLVPDQIIQLGYPPARIDILTTLPGVEFENCYMSRVQVEMEGIMVSYIDLENLKISKRASGRLQDLADIENLEQV